MPSDTPAISCERHGNNGWPLRFVVPSSPWSTEGRKPRALNHAGQPGRSITSPAPQATKLIMNINCVPWRPSLVDIVCSGGQPQRQVFNSSTVQTVLAVLNPQNWRTSSKGVSRLPLSNSLKCLVCPCWHCKHSVLLLPHRHGNKPAKIWTARNGLCMETKPSRSTSSPT